LVDLRQLVGRAGDATRPDGDLVQLARGAADGVRDRDRVEPGDVVQRKLDELTRASFVWSAISPMLFTNGYLKVSGAFCSPRRDTPSSGYLRQLIADSLL
jgi:hypothetical protein